MHTSQPRIMSFSQVTDGPGFADIQGMGLEEREQRRERDTARGTIHVIQQREAMSISLPHEVSSRGEVDVMQHDLGMRKGIKLVLALRIEWDR